jgi:protein-tyrosine phosphatase
VSEGSSTWHPGERRTFQRLRRGLLRRVHGVAGLLDRLAPSPPRPAPCDPQLAVLVVCHGNLCRSPMAVGVLRRRLASAGLLGRVVVDSAGTHATHPGRGPDWRARDCMRRHGDNIRDIRVRRFSRGDFARFDLILAMDQANRRHLLSLARTDAERARVRMLSGRDEVPDPAELGPRAFELAYQAIDRASRVLVEDLAVELDRERAPERV